MLGYGFTLEKLTNKKNDTAFLNSDKAKYAWTIAPASSAKTSSPRYLKLTFGLCAILLSSLFVLL